MNLRNRRLRLALVLGFAVAVLYIAWRLDSASDSGCSPARNVETSPDGKVTRIERKTCRG